MRPAPYMATSALALLLASACSREAETSANQQDPVYANAMMADASNPYAEAEMQMFQGGDATTAPSAVSEPAPATASNEPAAVAPKATPKADVDAAQPKSDAAADEPADPHAGHDMDNMSNMSH